MVAAGVAPDVCCWFNYFRLKNLVYFVYFVQLLTGYGLLDVYGIFLVTKLVDAPNPWVITGYGVGMV